MTGPACSSTTFAYHRGVAPMAWVLFGLASIELVVVHLLVALRWPWLAWPLTALTAASLAWIVLWIRSMARLPHMLGEGSLLLRAGSLRQISVPLGAISVVRRSWPPGAHKEAGVRNLVPLAYPNRMLVLSPPLADRRPVHAVMIRLDDPAAFDAGLAAQGVRFED